MAWKFTIRMMNLPRDLSELPLLSSIQWRIVYRKIGHIGPSFNVDKQFDTKGEALLYLVKVIGCQGGDTLDRWCFTMLTEEEYAAVEPYLGCWKREEWPE